uniref:hypothetical protein n=1 Tax=Aliarcobacter sp. TaxID=2321116 RepID=UPI004047FAD6
TRNAKARTIQKSFLYYSVESKKGKKQHLAEYSYGHIPSFSQKGKDGIFSYYVLANLRFLQHLIFIFMFRLSTLVSETKHFIFFKKKSLPIIEETKRRKNEL